MPRTMNPRRARSMLVHQSEEFAHGEMALRDLMGIDAANFGAAVDVNARKHEMRPEAFALPQCGG